MTFTGIGEKNFEAFSGLLGGSALSADKMYIGVIEDEKAVGACEFSSDGSLLLIDSIFVSPEYRRRGIASAMLDEIISVARQAGADGVWTDYVDDAVLGGFFNARGFLAMEDCSFYQVPVHELIEADTAPALFDMLNEKPGDAGRAHTFDELSPTQINVIKNKLFQNGLSDVDELFASLSRLKYSIAVFKNAECKEISALILADVEGDYITIKYLANIGGNPKDFIFLLKLFWQLIISKRMTYKILSFCTAEPEIKQIISKFAGQELRPTGSMMVAYKALGGV